MLFNDAASFFFADASGALIKVGFELIIPESGIKAMHQKIGAMMPNLFPDLVKPKEGEKAASRTNTARIIGGAIKLIYASDEYFGGFGGKSKVQSTIGDKAKAGDSSQDQEQWVSYGHRNSSATLDLHMRTAGGMCGNSFGVTMDDNIAHESKLKAFIVDYVTEMRGILDANFRNQFTLLEPNAEALFMISYVSKFMAVGKMSQGEIFNKDLKKMEL